MAKSWAIDFYQSKSWKETRRYIFKRDYGLCVKCKENPGEIVHHIIPLTPNNINNVNISLAHSNLMLVCRSCHEIIHSGTGCTTEDTMFNEEGDLIDIKDIHK